MNTFLPYRHSPLLPVVVAQIVGTLLAYWLLPPEGWLLGCAVVALVAAFCCSRHPMAQTLLILLSMALLGAVLTVQKVGQLRAPWPSGLVERNVVIASTPEPRPKTYVMDVLTTDGGRKLRCYVMKDERSSRLQVGDGLRIRSVIEPIDRHRLYHESRGYAGRTIVWADNWQPRRVSLLQLSRLQRARLRFLGWRQRLLERYKAQQMTADVYGVVAAMTLGDKSALSQQLRDTYSVTGASHVLALSGLHLGIIYALLSLTVRGRRLRVVSQLLIVLSIWAFALLVGLAPSVVRSATMLSVYAILSVGHRDRMSVNTLAFTAIAMLLVNPLALFDVGFQMSFMAVFSILMCHPLLSSWVAAEWLQRHQVARWCWQLTAVSLSAQVGVAPLIAYYFHRFSTVFLLANFVVVPAATVVLYGTLLMLLVPALGCVPIAVVQLMNTVLGVLARWPYASIDGLYPTVLQTLFVYVAIASAYILLTRLTQLFPK